MFKYNPETLTTKQKEKHTPASKDLYVRFRPLQSVPFMYDKTSMDSAKKVDVLHSMDYRCRYMTRPHKAQAADRLDPEKT
jgi:hypothetical protein